MMSVVFNFLKTYVHQRVESVALKTAYLLSRKIASAGTTLIDMDFKKKYSTASLFEQMEIIERISRYNRSFNKEVLKTCSAMKKLHRSNKKTPALQAIRWEGERLIQSTFQTMMNSYDGVMNKYGLLELNDLVSDDAFLIYLMNDNPEDPSGNRLTASELLQMRLYQNNAGDDAEEPEIFMLDAGFLTNRNEQAVCNIQDSNVADKEDTYLHHCFTLYGINRLNADELKACRQNIQGYNSQFQQQMDQWIDLCYFGDGNPDTFLFYKENVLPAAEDLQRKLDADSSVNNTGNCEHARLRTEVWIGEMPVTELWNYYREQHVIKDKTWHKLSRLCEDEAYKNKRWPVMALRIPEEQLEQMQADDLDEEIKMLAEPAQEVFEEETYAEIVPVRKYLLID